ncbi:hypothetical protein Moror_15189 [Moniliophthora roreri MCA 2997]|uniref:DUF6697 domain-containing protein n=2 Tax=Moniliophthora roreri TaxID=221103 RepID=V2X2S1_MONRO|nr:hypothetical protein Moror_15189 [Moniliophthora roreri MCA 2997]KAI3595144.1 hypothetical protein WG66_009368 [Moniliophthora roreri]
MISPVSFPPTPIPDDFDFEAWLKQPPDRDSGPLSISKRNEINCLAEKHNEESIQQTIACREDRAKYPSVGPALKAYYGYTDTEMANLVQSERRCKEWGPLPQFLRRKVEDARLGIQGAKEEEKDSVDLQSVDVKVIHYTKEEVKKVEEQVGESCNGWKWKREDDRDVKHEAVFKKEDINSEWTPIRELSLTRTSTPAVAQDSENAMDVGISYRRLETPPVGVTPTRSPSPGAVDRLPSEGSPVPPSHRSKRKRAGSPLPEASTRSLRPRIAKNYRELNAGATISRVTRSQDRSKDPTSPNSGSTQLQTLPERVNSVEGGQLPSTPAQPSTTRRRTKTQKLADIPSLEPGDGVNLPAEEYYRRKYPEDTIKREEIAVNLNETLRSLPVNFITPLPRHEEEVSASRLCWSYLFGGNPQETFAFASKQPNPDLTNFMFINRNYNPDAPTHPGSSGLFLDGEADPEKPDIAEDFEHKKVVVARNGPNDWILIGLAEIKGLQCLSPEEWKSLKPKCKETWINGCDRKRWGGNLKARIILRKRLHREPRPEEVEDAVEKETKRVNAIDAKIREKTGKRSWTILFHEVTKEEIKDAFDSGKARLMVHSIQCVDYPVEIQKRIIAEGPAFDRNPRAFMGPPKKKPKTGRSTVKKPQVVQKAKPAIEKKDRAQRRAS